MGCSPYLVDYLRGIFHGESFIVEEGVDASYHVEQYSEACGIALGACLCCPIARTDAPCLVRTSVVGVVPLCHSAILGIEADEVDSHGWCFLLDLACYLEHHSHSTRSVIGSIYRCLVVYLVAVVVCPRACVPMGADEDASRTVLIVGRNDVAHLDRCSVIEGKVGILVLYACAETLELGGKIIATGIMSFGIHGARSECTLGGNIAESAIGTKLGSWRLVWFLFGGLLACTASATCGQQCRSTHRHHFKYFVHIRLKYMANRLVCLFVFIVAKLRKKGETSPLHPTLLSFLHGR